MKNTAHSEPSVEGGGVGGVGGGHEDGDLLSALTKLEDEHDESLPSKLKFSILKLAKEKLIEVI